MTETDDVGGRPVQAVQTSCEILEALLERDSAGVTELAESLGRSKATIHGHLSTLHDNELVARDGDRYRISLRFVDFGEHAKRNVQVYDVAREEIDRLAEETGEVAQLMVKEHGRGVYLHKAEGEHSVRTASYPGARNHLHCTALGKAILAHLPEERVHAILDEHGLPQMTENTITDREALFAELEDVRDHGTAVDNEEILQGLRCIAAPLHGNDGTLYGAISVSGPTSRMQGTRFEETLPDALRGAANVIQINATQQ
ncbi:IclR family transcriptional regulator [Halorarius litoreus]|uniref:IclR family transcriptional regulator n=1 Tax=Halorarius litoreus TaxID=2962676 RepID=UPI0020CBB9C0|nr:IclR family transcriptional regulator [Halorarius litoreus]